MANPYRYVCRQWLRPVVSGLGLLLLVGMPAAWVMAQPPEEVAPPAGAEVGPEVVADVRVVGNQSVALDRIVPFIRTRPGRPYDRRLVVEDVRRLNKSRLFGYVSTENQRDARGGLIVLFRVVERPVLRYVKYVGLRNALAAQLTEETGLKPGQPVDPYAVGEGRRKIEEFYKAKGFNLVQVSIREGTQPTDRGAIYVINEGPQQQITGFEFHGNQFVSGRRLKTQIQSGDAWLDYFFGFLNVEQLNADVKLLEKYYKNLGFLTVRVSRELEFDESQTGCTVHFTIDEGPRCQISSVRFIGITKFGEPDMEKMLKVTAGDFYDGALLQRDKAVLEQIYGSYGYVFANVKPEPRVSEDASRMDLVYVIDEGKRYRVGNIRVNIEGDDTHTNIRTVLDRIELQPGDIVDIRKLRRSEVRLQRSSLFHVDPARGIRPEILVVPVGELENGERIVTPRRPSGSSGVRGQSPDDWQPGDVVIDLRLIGRLQRQAPQSPPPSAGGSPAPQPNQQPFPFRDSRVPQPSYYPPTHVRH